MEMLIANRFCGGVDIVLAQVLARHFMEYGPVYTSLENTLKKKKKEEKKSSLLM